MAALGMVAGWVLPAASETVGTGSGDFGTVGLYVWRDTPAYHPFWKACGFNLLQFCDTLWATGVEQHDESYRRFAAEIARAKAEGFKTDVILFSNIEQWPGPGPSPNPVGERFHPGTEPEKLAARLGYIRRSVAELKAADSFTFLAGDPGGGLGMSLDDCMAMAKAVAGIVQSEAPGAGYNLNVWCITHWQDYTISAMTPEFWRQETRNARRILALDGGADSRWGVQFPTHDYYRSLTLKKYSEAGLAPEPYPVAEDLAALHNRGAARLWAWPYFLLDAADDGYINAEFPNRHRVQCQTRYTKAYLDKTRNLGFDGIVASFAFSGFEDHLINYYAFGRFVREPELTPDCAIDEYAALLVEPSSVPVLSAVFKYLENQGAWHLSLPKEYRLPDFQTPGITCAADALRLCESLEPLAESRIPMPLQPKALLAAIRESLAVLERDAAKQE